MYNIHVYTLSWQKVLKSKLPIFCNSKSYIFFKILRNVLIGASLIIKIFNKNEIKILLTILNKLNNFYFHHFWCLFKLKIILEIKYFWNSSFPSLFSSLTNRQSFWICVRKEQACIFFIDHVLIGWYLVAEAQVTRQNLLTSF